MLSCTCDSFCGQFWFLLAGLSVQVCVSVFACASKMCMLIKMANFITELIETSSCTSMIPAHALTHAQPNTRKCKSTAAQNTVNFISNNHELIMWFGRRQIPIPSTHPITIRFPIRRGYCSAIAERARTDLRRKGREREIKFSHNVLNRFQGWAIRVTTTHMHSNMDKKKFIHTKSFTQLMIPNQWSINHYVIEWTFHFPIIVWIEHSIHSHLATYMHNSILLKGWGLQNSIK